MKGYTLQKNSSLVGLKVSYRNIYEEFICKKTINTTLKKNAAHYSPHIARSEPKTYFVKKACIVHFQGIASSRFTAEADKRPCCFWTEADKSILANQRTVFRSGDKATFTLKRCYNGEGKALCIACNHIHKSMITTTTFVRHLHCHLRRLQRLNKFFFYSKTWNVELSAFAKKLLLELSAFAIKQTFNM